ncbi:MAG TPA: glycogen synthase GlgA [Paracoccaceae bacterium]|nr:glycogen synthase GlgA [Paracoccaceae bacterium]
MAVLFVASECAPLVKTGGLADVVGALPRALAAAGCRVRVLIPAYPGVAERAGTTEAAMEIPDLFGGPARLLAASVAGLDLLLLDAPHLYDRPGGPYQDDGFRDWPDNHLRFGALCQVAAGIGRAGLPDGWRPEIVHAHDWQAGLAPLYLSDLPERPATVTTIHNVAFQGNFDAGARRALGLPEAGFTPAGYEFWGRVSFLKAGLIHSDAITTVSPTYARELTTAEFGFDMQGVIAERAGRLSGILNGIDLDEWNPETDPHIARFGLRRLQARQKNRAALAAEFGIEPGDGPVFAVVSRLSWQKGLDLLLEVLPRLVGQGGSLVVLGAGEPALEDGFRAAAVRHPGRVGVRIGYDEALAHRIYAGADSLLVPSRFEPCGLTQLYAMRYGALPVVARTGGLADTVIDANEAALSAGAATGFQFTAGSADALSWGIERACALFRDRPGWAKAQRNAMRASVGWDSSAARYRGLYEALLAGRR